MDAANANPVSRQQIFIRFLYSLLFIMVLEVAKTVVVLTTFFQYLFLFINKTHSEPVRKFANQAAAYGYRVMRYLTLNENVRPFPFQDFPQELEPPEEGVVFR
jgi:D-alanyl-lipoteichoic acid acyltransferase DltB (MBOAT superfamily)